MPAKLEHQLLELTKPLEDYAWDTPDATLLGLIHTLQNLIRHTVREYDREELEKSEI
jgi:hypothetical protein